MINEEPPKKEKVCDSQLFKLLNDKEKVLFILYDNPNLTRKGIVNLCPSVHTVHTVHTVHKDKKDKKDKQPFTPIDISLSSIKKDKKDKKDNDIDILGTPSKLESNINKIITRGINQKTIQSDKSELPYKYSLTEKGIVDIDKRWNEYKKEILEVLDRKAKRY